jgi:DNA-binding response OmpR family regulator
VLVVEDNPGVAEMLDWAFSLAWYSVSRVAVDQIPTLAWVDQMGVDRPALLLLDIDAGGMLTEPGAFLRRIRHRWHAVTSMEMTPIPPIILLTTRSHQQPDLEQEGYPVLLKPFYIDALYRAARVEIDRYERLLLNGQALAKDQGEESRRSCMLPGMA